MSLALLQRPAPPADELLFRAFAQELRESRVRCCFLRGHGAFPRLDGASDIDMLVHPAQRREAEDAFHAAARATGFTVWQHFRSGPLSRLYAYRKDSEVGHVFFDVDLHASEAAYGVPYLHAEELLDLVESEDPIPRLPEEVQDLVSVAGRLASSGTLPEKDLLALAQRPVTDSLHVLIERLFGPGLGGRFEEGLREPGQSWIRRSSPKLGRAIRRRGFFRNPVLAPLRFFGFAWAERVRPYLRPRGLFLIFLGTDGSGKTTLQSRFIERVGPRFRDGTVLGAHLRPGILPQISSLFHGGKPAYSLADMSSPHRATPSGFLGSALRATYYWVDYSLGYFFRILPLRRRNSLLIYDRWFYDYLVDPLRFRVQLGHPLPSILSSLLPKPDAVVICTAPPDRILQRKRELSPEEVERQVHGFRALAERLPRAFLIDTTASEDECLDRLIETLFTRAVD